MVSTATPVVNVMGNKTLYRRLHLEHNKHMWIMIVRQFYDTGKSRIIVTSVTWLTLITAVCACARVLDFMCAVVSLHFSSSSHTSQFSFSVAGKINANPLFE